MKEITETVETKWYFPLNFAESHGVGLRKGTALKWTKVVPENFPAKDLGITKSRDRKLSKQCSSTASRAKTALFNLRLTVSPRKSQVFGPVAEDCCKRDI